jgi:hypothetical protein
MRTLLFLFLLSISLTVYSATRTIHVVVALCDNVNQGIVPVPKAIGNGQDPFNNLYWGCPYGVKTFFKKQPEWIFLKQFNSPAPNIYERIVFKHRDSSVYLIADAYDGAHIKETTVDFLNYAAGKNEVIVTVNGVSIKAGGSADLLCYVGHDGLMDFSLDNYPSKSGTAKKETIILACQSKYYFTPALKASQAHPLLWTSGLMCPEAYTLSAACQGWVLHESNADIRERAAKAYNTYQKCGMTGARNLFVTGW